MTDFYKINETARRCMATSDELFLILAIIETDAQNTPFFSGMNLDELVAVILMIIRIRRELFYKQIIDDYSEEDFIGVLAAAKEFGVTRANLESVFNDIKKQGERYEFKRIDGLDKKDAKYSGVKRSSAA